MYENPCDSNEVSSSQEDEVVYREQSLNEADLHLFRKPQDHHWASLTQQTQPESPQRFVPKISSVSQLIETKPVTSQSSNGSSPARARHFAAENVFAGLEAMLDDRVEKDDSCKEVKDAFSGLIDQASNKQTMPSKSLKSSSSNAEPQTADDLCVAEAFDKGTDSQSIDSLLSNDTEQAFLIEQQQLNLRKRDVSKESAPSFPSSLRPRLSSKCTKLRDRSSVGQSLSLTTTQSLLEKSRRVAQKQRHLQSESATGSQMTRRRKIGDVKPMPVSVSKSIVGSRPKHWGIERQILHGLGTYRPGLLRGDYQASLLAEATKVSSSKLLQPFQPSQCLSLPAAALSWSTSPKERSFPLSDTRQEKVSPMTLPASFAPSFCAQTPTSPVPTYASNALDVLEDTDDRETLESPILKSPTSFHSPPPKRSTRKLTGTLAKRLKTLRDSSIGDSIRLQSGQYPFGAKSTDWNDPRSRASSYLDVTIIGEAKCWENDPKKLTTLAYVHRYCTVKESSTLPTKGFVWLCLTHEMARMQSVRVGLSLRIYNAVVVPWNEASTPHALSYNIQHIVFDTQLCEPYPDTLPPLPECT